MALLANGAGCGCSGRQSGCGGPGARSGAVAVAGAACASPDPLDSRLPSCCTAQSSAAPAAAAAARGDRALFESALAGIAAIPGRPAGSMGSLWEACWGAGRRGVLPAGRLCLVSWPKTRALAFARVNCEISRPGSGLHTGKAQAEPAPPGPTGPLPASLDATSSHRNTNAGDARGPIVPPGRRANMPAPAARAGCPRAQPSAAGQPVEAAGSAAGGRQQRGAAAAALGGGSGGRGTRL